MAQQAFTRPSLASSAQTTKLATLLLLVLLLCCSSAPAAARRRRRGANSELNNPANPNSKSYHSLYNGPGNGNAGGNGNGQGNGLDGNPDAPRGKSGFGYARPGRGPGGNGINYNGGPVMVDPLGVKVYIIWYGNWAGSQAPAIISDFLANLGGSGWWNISTTYYNSAGAKISPAVQVGSSITVDSSSSGYKGTSLTDDDIWGVVQYAMSNGLPTDYKGVYFVLTSQDVTASSGFCTQYCGWHWWKFSGSDYIKFSFVGNTNRCPSACSAQTYGPNGGAGSESGADGMISIIAHELTEAASDPVGNAWYDSRGYENADKCAWTFGTTSAAPNGAKYNVQLGLRKYLVQQNWVNAAGGYCAMK